MFLSEFSHIFMEHGLAKNVLKYPPNILQPNVLQLDNFYLCYIHCKRFTYFYPSTYPIYVLIYVNNGHWLKETGTP